ncbi:hypothetical protein ACF09E_34760 [Streptomyces sp. NPDC014891]|uniref:hypothetical protein n=1 Tax=Streptomyces sp. NPDC014891 TaxID=3364929 RepID=UPI0036FB71AB
MVITFTLGVPRDAAPVKLTPVHDPERDEFSVELWENGQFAAAHGPFRLAADAVETSDAFLAEHGIRPLTAAERTALHTRLVARAGGEFRAIVMRELARQEDEAAFRMADVIEGHLRRGESVGWLAINVRDGGSDGRLYRDWLDARSAQAEPDGCTYMPMPVWPMTPDECAEHLAFVQQLAPLAYPYVDRH